VPPSRTGAAPPNSYPSIHISKPTAQERFDTTKAEPAPPAIAAPKPKSRDINDVKTEHGIDEVRQMFDSAESDELQHGDKSAKWPEPDMHLIEDDRLPPPPFDCNALPPALVDWVKKTAMDCGAPADYIAATLLSVASAVIGNARRVSPWGGWVEQPHLWVALIGQPSTNKTVALAPFKTACKAIEKDAEPAHNEALKRYAEKKQAADAARHQWQEAVKLAAKNNESPPMMGHVFRDLLVTDAYRDAASLARFIKASSANGKPLTVLNERGTYKGEGFHRLRDKQHRDKVFAELEEAGWLRRAAVRTGGRPRGDWNVNPKVWER
jgi:hypothetical protein